MENQNLELFLITQLILEYRPSLETISQIFNTEPNDMYNKVISVNNGIIKHALRYVLDHETQQYDLIDQKVAKRKILVFLTRLNLAKTPTEKLEIIKSLDNGAVLKGIKKKGINDIEEADFEVIIKHRYKYALSKKRIQDEFNITRKMLEHRESKLDGDMYKKIMVLNEYNNYSAQYDRNKNRQR